MEKQAIVSIIVPVYNAEDYIKKCISSICTQSVSELQIILVDDGSTDNSLEICRQLQKNDNRIEVFHQENQGASAARNKGMQLANAEWVMFVDSDDWLEENAVQTLCEEASHADSDIIMGMIVNNYSFSDEDAADGVMFQAQDPDSEEGVNMVVTATDVGTEYDLHSMADELATEYEDVEKVCINGLYAVSFETESTYGIAFLEDAEGMMYNVQIGPKSDDVQPIAETLFVSLIKTEDNVENAEAETDAAADEEAAN